MTSLTGAIESLYDAALSLIFPQTCAVCEAASVEARADNPACAACWQTTHIFTGGETLCWKCGAPAMGTVARERWAAVCCRRCEAESFTAARAVGMYEGALRASVLALKHEPHVAARLAHLLFETQRRPPLNAATRIVPVPLHTKREHERGFNQATILARAIAAQTRLTCDELSVIRTTHAERHRAGMDAQARRETVEQAYQVIRPRLIKDESVLLVDDVFTTGATVSSCAKALRAAGAQEVFALTVARV
jgi:ComF family protein